MAPKRERNDFIELRSRRLLVSLDGGMELSCPEEACLHTPVARAWGKGRLASCPACVDVREQLLGHWTRWPFFGQAQHGGSYTISLTCVRTRHRQPPICLSHTDLKCGLSSTSDSSTIIKTDSGRGNEVCEWTRASGSSY